MTKKPEYVAGEVINRGDPIAIQENKITNMGDAIELAMQRARDVEDPDPDIYGYQQEVENTFGVDLLTPNWKAKPDDTLWVKRMKARGRKAAIAKLFLQGRKIAEIAQLVKVSEVTVYRDIQNLSQEWRKSYMADIEILAGIDLARLENLLVKLAPGIETGDTKSITAALEIIKERGQILGYRSGVQVDIETYVREVAEANGYDPEKAVQIAQRISVTMH